MKQSMRSLVLVLSIIMGVTAFAGGGSCRFKTEGRPLLQQAPLLAEFIATKFAVVDEGTMGPVDAPFDGARLYTFMEFRAHALASPRDAFTIRIHFKGDKLDRMEIIPTKSDTKGQ